jgi:hypothetical protein
MPYGVRRRDGEWCVVNESDGTTVSNHLSRVDALTDLCARYYVDPSLAGFDHGEQRVIASAAQRWQSRYQVGGTERALYAAARLAIPVPLSADEVAWCDEVARSEPDHRHLSKDLAGRRWPRTAAVSRSRMRKLSRDLAVIDQRLGDRLYAIAVTATRDALRRAGVKAVVRAKNRGKTAALETDGLTPAVLAAIGTSPDELLDRAFLSLQDEAEAQIVASNRQRARAIADAFDVDPDDLEDDPQGDQRAKWAAALLAAGLLRRARAALSTAAEFARRLLGRGEGPIPVPVPFVEVRTAMRVRDGWQVIQDIRPGPNLTPEADAGITLVPPEHGSSAIDDLLGRATGGAQFIRLYTWVHSYFGEPAKPFPPHEALDGAEYDDDTRAEVLAADPSEWPYVAVYSVEDHDDCRCWELITYEPGE